MRQSKYFSMLLFLALPFLLLSCGDAKKENAEQAGTDTTAATPAPEPAAPAVSTIVTTPQNMVMVLHKVANFQKWHAAYDADDSARLANGLHNYVIGRGLRDTNMVLVVMKADDVEKAKARGKSPDLKKVMQKAGVTSTPEFLYVTTTWQDTANIGDVIRSRTIMNIKDYTAWEKNFQDGKQERLDNGIADRAYGYDASDKTKVSLVTAVTDTTKAFAYYTSDALKKRRAAGGVTGEPKRFLFRIAKRY